MILSLQITPSNTIIRLTLYTIIIHCHSPRNISNKTKESAEYRYLRRTSGVSTVTQQHGINTFTAGQHSTLPHPSWSETGGGDALTLSHSGSCCLLLLLLLFLLPLLFAFVEFAPFYFHSFLI